MRLVAVIALTMLLLGIDQAYNKGTFSARYATPVTWVSPLDNPLYELHVSRKNRRSYDLHNLMWYSHATTRFVLLHI